MLTTQQASQQLYYANCGLDNAPWLAHRLAHDEFALRPTLATYPPPGLTRALFRAR